MSHLYHKWHEMAEHICYSPDICMGHRIKIFRVLLFLLIVPAQFTARIPQEPRKSSLCIYSLNQTKALHLLISTARKPDPRLRVCTAVPHVHR